jgi:hypothetical protein
LKYFHYISVFQDPSCVEIEYQCWMHSMEFNICERSKILLDEYLRPCSAFTIEDIIKTQDTKILWDGIKMG